MPTTDQPLFTDNLFLPSEGGWLELCKTKVRKRDTEWLKQYAVESTGKLDLPNGVLESLYSETLYRKNALLFIANCALVALIQSGERGSGSLSDHLLYAIAAWHRRSEPEFTLSVATLSKTENDIEQITAKLLGENSEIEIAPTLDLIRFFADSDNKGSSGKAKIFKTMFPLVHTQNNTVRLSYFEVERVLGNGLVYCDPRTMAFVIVDTQFQKSVTKAADYVCSTSGDWKAYDYRWRVRWVGKKESIISLPLTSRSVGLAAAMALEDAVRGKNLAKKFAFTGEIDEKGNIGRVMHIQEKEEECVDRKTTLFMPTDANSSTGRSTSKQVKLVSSFSHTRDTLSSLRKTDYLQKVIKYGLIVIGVVLILIFIGMLWYRQNVAEMKAEAERREKNAAVLLAKASNTNAVVEHQKRLNADQKRDLAIREANLERQQKLHERQQKEVLRKKNVELGIARDEEAKQRKIAEESEAKAKAYEQVARAGLLATNGYKQLSEGDLASSQAFFAKALMLDDRKEYRDALARSRFGLGGPTYRLSWVIDAPANGKNAVRSMSLSPDGKFLALSYSGERVVTIVAADSGKTLFQIPVETTPADIALSPRARFLAILGPSGGVSVINVATGDLFYSFATKSFLPSTIGYPNRPLAFNDDGKFLAAILDYDEIGILGIEDRQIVRVKQNPPTLAGAISALAFGPRNNIAFVFSGPSPIFLVSNQGRSKVSELNFRGLHFSLGFAGSYNLVDSLDGKIRVVETWARSELDRLPDSREVRRASSRPDYQIASNLSLDHFASVGDSGIVHLFDDNGQIGQISFSMGRPERIMLGADGRLVLQNIDGSVFSWEVIAADYKSLTEHEDEVMAKIGHTRGLYCENNRLMVKDLTTEAALFSTESNNCDAVASLSADEKVLFVSRDKESIQAYEIETGKLMAKYDGLAGLEVGEVNLILPDSLGSRVAVMGSSSIAIIPNKGVPYRVLSPTEDRYFQLAFSPQDRFLLLQAEKSIYLIDPISGKQVQSIPSTRECEDSDFWGPCSWVAMNKNEEYLGMVTRLDGMVKIWNLKPYRHLEFALQTGKENPENAVGAAFTSDGRYFVWSSGASGRLHFFDLASEKQNDFPTGGTIIGLRPLPSGGLVVAGPENVYVLTEDALASLFDATPEQTYLKVNNRLGRKVNTDYEPSLDQRTLHALVGSSGFDEPEVLATDKLGITHRPIPSFGGVELQIAKKGRDGTTTCPVISVLPFFNAYPITFDDRHTPRCADFPLLDLAKDQFNPEFSKTGIDYSSVREFHADDTIAAMIYIDNGAADTNDDARSTAKHVEVRTQLSSDGNLHYITATVTATNAQPLSQTIVVRTKDDEYLEIIPNSGFMYDYVGHVILDQQGLDLGNSTFLLGDLPEGWEYSLFLTYKIRVRRRH